MVRREKEKQKRERLTILKEKTVDLLGRRRREKEKKSLEKEKDLLKEGRALKVLADLKRKLDSYSVEIINDSS